MTESMERIGNGEDVGEEPTPSRAASRRRLFLAVAVVSAVLATGGVAAATLVKSPAQVAAESKAPPASVITARVEKRVLSDTVVGRGNVAASAQFQVTPQSAQGAAVQVVTAVHVKTGGSVQAGGVMLEVAGRPLIALPGAVPIYRDLRPGAHGADVAELQQALTSLGYGTGGDTAGEYGQGTKEAVKQLYGHLGFDCPTTGPDDAAKLKTAQQAVDTAQRQVDDLTAQLDAAAQAPAPTPAPGGGGVGAKSTTTTGGGESLATQLKYAKKALVSAHDDYRTLVATTGPMVPVSEAVFLPAFPAQVSAFAAKVGDPVKAPLITLSTGKLGVYSQMTPDRAALLKPGMPVQIAVTGTDRHTTGKISSVGEPAVADTSAAAPAAGGGGGGGGGGALMSRVDIAPDTDLGPEWAGKDVQLTVTSASSGADVLVVPLSAVSTGADGRASVVKAARESGPPTARVDIVAGLSGGGFVQVTPVNPGELAQGDEVLVSQK